MGVGERRSVRPEHREQDREKDEMSWAGGPGWPHRRLCTPHREQEAQAFQPLITRKNGKIIVSTCWTVVVTE